MIPPDRTCNGCHMVYPAIWGVCPRCRCPEFSLPKAVFEELERMEKEKRAKKKGG